MRILFINIYQNLVSRGAETYVSELAARLGGEVDILSDSGLPPKRGFFLWRFFLDLNALSVAWFTIKNLGKIVRGKYDIVIPLNGGWQSLIVRIATWITGSKMIISGQSGNGWDDRINLYCFPDCFVSLTDNSLAWAKKINRFVNIQKIPNGVDLKKFSTEGVVYKSGLKKPLVLAVGAFTLQKNLDSVIEAVSLLKDVSLIIAGAGGDQENFLRELGSVKLPGRFKIITVPYRHMPSVYRCADVFTLVSESSEAFGNVYVEAMACGLPVVATNDPQRREVLGDAGRFVDPKNITKLAEAISAAIKLKNEKPSRKQAEKFSWDEVAKEYDQLISMLITK